MSPIVDHRAVIGEKIRFIIIAGLIGAGKTTLTQMLSAWLGFKPLYELAVRCPYLGPFYKDPKTHAYPMQEWFKSNRFRAHQFAVWAIRAGEVPGVVMDRSIWEDTIFAEINRARGNISNVNFETYLTGFSDMTHFLMDPDLVIYLDASPETCRERILRRDRPEERASGLVKTKKLRPKKAAKAKKILPKAKNGSDKKGIPLDYLYALKEKYEQWLGVIAPRMPVVRVPWEQFRPVEDVWPEVIQRIEERTRYTRSLVLP